MKRKASIATAAVFLAVLFGFSLLHLALPDREVSRSERRRLAQLPPLSSGFSDKLEEYMLDQFPLREQLRTVNSLVRLYGLGQADIHGIYLQGGGAFRMDGPLQEKQVRHAAAVFSAVQETYFPSLPSHYVIVPDKNAKAETSRPRLDTETLRGIVREALPGMTEIDIWDLLSADDYYKTDPHWRQERLPAVARYLAGAMGADAAAHRGALDAMRAYGIGQAGRTVAVFAGGLNHAGPQCNSELFDGIAENGGALVSELCPGTIPEARRFLSRNRIIAALSSTLVVTQARLRSGALNTVNWGSELQRDIHAVPGNIDMPGNSGCNRLIQEQRATIVCSVADMDDVWHAPHPPESFHDVATQRKDGSDCDVGTPRDAGILRDSSPSGGNRSSAMTESQRAIIDAIRWCRRRRIAPTAQSVAEQLRTRSGEKGLETGATEGRPTEGKSTEGKGADAVPERGMHELVAHVLSQLGTMELIGLITVENGRISIVPETGGRRRS